MKFKNKIENIWYNYCLTCNKRIPLIILIKGECYCCYTEKVFIDKFLVENNIDLKDIPSRAHENWRNAHNINLHGNNNI